ncbi:MAG: cytochrome C [Chryseobacterium sp.]|jgi:cytochrome c|uniref:c-type cytochrome n=1 Tax=Chryseobacterium sp. TaxID=1871047 RepID=UPI00281E7444|nr:c-type cytochrome [Chryseobacterium sp.]MDR2235007.1 cytochrome C [Chryseobacterium sp.]
MKSLVLSALATSFLMMSCAKNNEMPTQPEPETNQMLEEPKPADPAQNTATEEASSPEAKGLALIKGTDCLSCHQTDQKLIGPSYHDVAAKYSEADADMLAQKIIDGGKGNWGDIPMTPHAGLSKENAKLMVKYILSLKK